MSADPNCIDGLSVVRRLAKRTTEQILADAINELWRIESEAEVPEWIRVKAAIARDRLAVFVDEYKKLAPPDHEQT